MTVLLKDTLFADVRFDSMLSLLKIMLNTIIKIIVFVFVEMNLVILTPILYPIMVTDIKFVKPELDHRIPEIGISFLAGMDKGTVGRSLITKMPFTSNGITPDIIINPHAVPSRMTIAQLIERILGKAALETGNIGNLTAFDPISIDIIPEILTKYGHKRRRRNSYNGINGDQIKTQTLWDLHSIKDLQHMSGDVKFILEVLVLLFLYSDNQLKVDLAWWFKTWRMERIV